MRSVTRARFAAALSASLASVVSAQPHQLDLGDAVFVARIDENAPFAYFALNLPDRDVAQYEGVQSQLSGGLNAWTLLDPNGLAKMRHLFPTAGTAEFAVSSLLLEPSGQAFFMPDGFVPQQLTPRQAYDTVEVPRRTNPPFLFTGDPEQGTLGVFTGDGDFGGITQPGVLESTIGADYVRGPLLGKLGLIGRDIVVVADNRRDAVVLIDVGSGDAFDLATEEFLRAPSAVAVAPYAVYVACPATPQGDPARIVEVRANGRQSIVYEGDPFFDPSDMAYYDGGYAGGPRARLLVSERRGPFGRGGIILLDLGAKSPSADPLSTGDADGYVEPTGVSTVQPGSDCPGSDCPGSDCPGDTTGDGRVNTNDFFQYLAWYQVRDDRADMTLDGLVNTNDFFQYLVYYQAGSDCP